MVLALSRFLSALRPSGIAAAVPLVALGAFWLGGETALLILAMLVPAGLLLFGAVLPVTPVQAMSDQVIERLDTALGDHSRGAGQTGCLILQFDEPSLICNRIGRTRQSELLATCIARLRGALRAGDMLFALEDGSLAVVLGPTPRLDLEVMVRIASRLQLVVQQPLVLAGQPIQVTCCVGFCHARQVVGDRGRAVLDAAQIAVEEALRHGPGAIRAYTADLARQRSERDLLRAEFAAAVEAGEVRAYFQPQLSTDTGEVSGVEALVRWLHPVRGCLSPGAFLSALDGTDLMDLLAQTMIDQSLSAVAAWDREGLRIPTVAVNLSAQDLRDPQLPDRLNWALDKHGLSPSRLTIEVLESVLAGEPDDLIVRNIDRIAKLGCGVDMDDFGTGNASITSIRRFALGRLKIDQSFVRGVDQDRDQQKLVTAILSLADRLELDTLAEGVETQGEHAILAQLGCGHVQGFAIAHPMPHADLAEWAHRHQARLSSTLRIGVRAR